MARAARDGDEPVSVEELLRAAGATARTLGDVTVEPPGRPSTPDETPEQIRERLEQRAREAAAEQQRAGRRVRWVAAACGGLVVAGSLVVIGFSSKPQRPVAAALESLQPAATTTTVVTTTPRPTPQSVPPIPTVLSARQTTTEAKSPSVPPPPPPPPSPSFACRVKVVVTAQWPGGYNADVTVTNTGTTTVSPWHLTWTFAQGQQVTNGWNGQYRQSGSHVAVDAADWNATLAPGGSATTGYTGSGSGPAAGGFTLNGSACA